MNILAISLIPRLKCGGGGGVEPGLHCAAVADWIPCSLWALVNVYVCCISSMKRRFPVCHTWPLNQLAAKLASFSSLFLDSSLTSKWGEN